MHQSAINFQNFPRELAYAPEPPSIYVQLYVFLLDYSHFLFKVTQQNDSKHLFKRITP